MGLCYISSIISVTEVGGALSLFKPPFPHWKNEIYQLGLGLG